MKLRNIMKIAAIFPVLAFGLASTADAHRVVHVEGKLYVIICDNNGGNFTFSGSAGGASEAAGLLCPMAPPQSGSGVSGGAPSPITIEKSIPASQALRTRSGGAERNCPPGTRWYEPAKTCVAIGGRPIE
ncbi:MAG: hypothetical protein ACK4YM_01195 [Novosphingobium sp.]